MNTEEQISWLGDASPAIERIGLPAYEWWSEALHGVASSPGTNFSSGPIRSATQFPAPITIAASFSRRLFREVATAVSTEARAMSNQRQSGLSFFTPNINLFRDPRWGRGQETPGEDPFLSAEFAFEVVRALQGGDDERYIKVIANCKHFNAYDMEDSGGTNRYQFDARVSDRDLVESYLPSFESCVRDARAASVMCAYNAVNGVPSCANSLQLQGIAREQWGLEGFVVSDCGAIGGIMNEHNYTHTVEDTVAAAMHAGVDLNCGDFYQKHTATALESGAISAGDLAQALRRSIGALVRTGFFDPAEMQPYRQIPPEAVNTADTQALALRAAIEGMVLLKNGPSPIATAYTLPWSAEGAPILALIGPLRNATTAMLSNYFGPAPFIISPLEALQTAGFTVVEAEGCAIDGDDESGFAEAVAVAQKAHFVLFVGGITTAQEDEARDRTSIDLPLIQEKLIGAISDAMQGEHSHPFATAFFGSGPVDYSAAVHSRAGAILWLGYPGQSGGAALAAVLTGAASPAGRLVTTVYPAAYAQRVSMLDMSFRPSATNPGRTYRFYPPDLAVFEFGFGMSYTKFVFEWLQGDESDGPVSDAQAADNDPAQVETFSIRQLHGAHLLDRRSAAVSWRVNVTNAGVMTSDCVVLLFLSPAAAPPADPSAPLKQLIGFDRIAALQPQETRQVFFGVQARQLALVNERGERWLQPGRYRLGLDVPTRQWREIELTGLAMQLH